MSEIILLQSAQADLLEIFSRHGEASYQRIDRGLEMIRTMPAMAPIYHGAFRRKLIGGTPHGIFYTIIGSRIMVSFILDVRQEPAEILKRLEIQR